MTRREDGGALAAILLGEKQGMDREIRELYQVNGIAHVFAVSGLHLSFLGVGVYHLLRRITGSYTVGGLAGVLFLSAYILMIGMTVSAFRAMVMFLLRIGADLSGRHYDSPTALAAAAVTVCMWRPLSLYDSGFWLSFGALIAIIFILPIFKNLPAQSLWASVSVNLFLLPILMYSFYEVPIYGVFLNLIVIPLLSVLMAAGLIGTMISLFWEHAGEAIFLCCRMIFRVYEHSCEAALRLPFARVVTGQPDIWKILFYYVFLFAAVLLLRKKEENKGEKRSRKKRGVLSVLLVGTGMTILLFTAQVKDKITITMLDVGQGDGLVIRGPEGKTYFMDGGSSDVKKVGEYRIEPYLLSQGIGSLDYVFVSHGDQDHISGIKELVQRQKTGVTIKRLVFPTQTVWDDALKELVEMAEKGEHADVVIMDPPRTGSDEAFLSSVVRLAPNKVVYVSCGPETLVRDLKYLTKHGYRMKECTPFDLFPFTKHVETVVLLSQLRQKPDDYIDVDIDVAELEGTSAETKATYEKIKKYVAEHNDGMKVSNLYIAQVKRKCGIELAENFNLPKSEDARQPRCPKEKEEAIVEALKAFQMI